MNGMLNCGLLVAGLAMVGQAAHAQAATEPAKGHVWYVAVGGTAANVEEADQRIANAPTAGSTLVARNDMETGWGWSLAFGRSFGSLRAEIEFGQVDSESDSYRISSPFQATVAQSGQMDVSRAMLNGFYDFGAETAAFRPYLGLGAGQAETSVVRIAGLAANPSAPPFRHIDDSSSSFAWQVMAGASLTLVPDRLSLTAQYRYLDGGEFEGRDSRGQSFVTDVTAHAVDVGLRLEF